MFKGHNHLRLLLAVLFLDGLDSGGSDSDSGGSDSGNDSASSSESANSASSASDAAATGADAGVSSSDVSNSSPGRKPIPRITDIPPEALGDIPFRQDS